MIFSEKKGRPVMRITGLSFFSELIPNAGNAARP